VDRDDLRAGLLAGRKCALLVHFAVSSAHASVLRVPAEERRVQRSLPLGIDDPTGSPSGRTRGRDACTNTPERSRSGSLLCVRGSAREPRRRRTSGASLGAASARLQARRSVKVTHYPVCPSHDGRSWPVRTPITLSAALSTAGGGGARLKMREGGRPAGPCGVPAFPFSFPEDSVGASSSEIVLIMGLPPEVLHDARHGSRVTSDTVQLRPPSVASSASRVRRSSSRCRGPPERVTRLTPDRSLRVRRAHHGGCPRGGRGQGAGGRARWTQSHDPRYVRRPDAGARDPVTSRCLSGLHYSPVRSLIAETMRARVESPEPR
jgi:hypothetical protein